MALHFVPHENGRSSQVITKSDHYQFSTLYYFLEFFASLFREAGRVSHIDSEQTTLEAGQIFLAGPSSCSSSPSTPGFDPNRRDQANGAGTKKQMANRRHRTRKHKKY